MGAVATNSIPLAAWAAASLLLAITGCKKAGGNGSASSPPAPAQPLFTHEELKQQRLDWNKQTLVDAYEHAGYMNPWWDDAAERALKEFARVRAQVLDTNEPWGKIIATNTAAAVKAGCKDPMVNYLFIRFSLDQTNSKETFTTAYFNMAQEMEKSSYPDLRKFYASFRAVKQYYWANHYAKLPDDWRPLGQAAAADLQRVLADKSVPAGEIYDAASEYLEMWKTTKKYYQPFYAALEQSLNNNWPNAPETFMLRGLAHVDMAWQERGGGYSDTVSSDGWKLFAKHLDQADEALTQAWKMDPTDFRTPLLMMKVELGQGKGRDRLDLWFNRAMNLDPNNYEACNMKLYYLEPKWYGSINDMLVFGRECVQNTNWGGEVPMILIGAHNEIRSQFVSGDVRDNYWKQPEVWPDIQAAYERYFVANSNADLNTAYNNYTMYAWNCGQWSKINELVPKLNPVNYSIFGGKESYDSMLLLAREHTAKSP